MKKITLSFFLLFTLVNNLITAQTPDRWDTLYNTTTISPPNYFVQCNSVVRNSKLFVWGDTVNFNNSYYFRDSYIAVFNPTTSALTPLAYTRTSEDHGLNGEATITTPTANLSYAFFGSKLSNSAQSNSLTLYKLNTLTQAVTYEQIAYPTAEYRKGISGLCFFSPTTNHDTLLIFDDSLSLKTSIYKKHYNQVGFSNTNNLSVPLEQIYSTFVFNNVLYVSGRDNVTFDPTLLSSNNGVTFTVNTNYDSNIGFRIIKTEIFNNILYFSINDGDGSYKIYSTPDMVNFTLLTGPNGGDITSLKMHDNKLWYSVTSSGRPTVRYLSAPSFTNEVTSVQDIGRQESDPYTFTLNKLNNELYFSGSYINSFQTPEFGTFIYKFIPPVANITLNSNQLCLNGSYNAINSSLNADSVRWIKDNNFYAGTANNFSFSFNTAGTHTLGIIAVSGTQKDTLLISVNVYSVSLNISAPATACQVTPFQIQSTANNTQGTVTYTWTQVPAFATPPTSASPTVSVLNPGSYSYYAVMADVHGCSATSNTVSLNVFSSKNISGVVTETNSTIVAGDAVLYRYEPILTKFDSVTTQPLNALGGYTFNTVDSGTYIIKCIPTNSTNLQVTYGNSSVSWLTAHVITHGCVNTSTQNISVIPIVSFGAGTGILTGQIMQGPGYGQKMMNGSSMVGPIKGVIVKGGRNPGGDIGAQSRTNSQGQYTLSGLPSNAAGENYFVLVDIPGLDTNTTYHRVITSTNLQFDNLDFTVDSAKINPIGNFVGVKEISFDDNKVRLYPNPTNGQLNVDFELATPSKVKVEVVDMLGRIVKTILPVSYQNQNEVKISSNIDGVPAGVYFVNIKIDHSQVAIKLIVTD